MTTHRSDRAQRPEGVPLNAEVTAEVVAWLLDADPAIRWQVLRDLVHAPPEAVATERQMVSTVGWGAELLARQGDDGTWSGVAWNRGWDSTLHALLLLREFGANPTSVEVQRAVERVRDRVTWRGCGPPETAHHRFFDGEVEPCINAQVAMVGAYFGQDVGALVDRLVGEQLADGGWNCEAERGSKRASFHTTICVLDALLEYESSCDPRTDLTEARRRGEGYLLERRLLRRRSTGELVVDRKGAATDWTKLAFPCWWHYDMLRGLDYLRRAGVAPDERSAEATACLLAKRGSDGRWRLDLQHAGRLPVVIDGPVDTASRWITLRAMRVLGGRAGGQRP